MVNLITPTNNKPISTNIAPNRAQQGEIVATNQQANLQPSQAERSNQNPKNTLVQWANVESNKILTTEQTARLIELNPTLAKTLIGQIKGESQANNSPLTPQSTALLKQSPLQWLSLKVNDTTLRMVTAYNIESFLQTKVQSQPANINPTLLSAQIDTAASSPKIPLVQSSSGWQIADTQTLKTALHNAATQLLKKNLPQQSSSLPLFKLAQAINTGQTSVLSHLPKTQTHIQTLVNQTIEPKQTQNPQALAQNLHSALKTQTTFKPINNAIQQLNTEAFNQIKPPPQNTQVLEGLDQSIKQLQNAITTQAPQASQKAVTTLSVFTTALTPLLKNTPALTQTQLVQVNQLTATLDKLSQSIPKKASLEQHINLITQQFNHFIQPINSQSHKVNTQANHAVLQLLGINLQNQLLDQTTLQQNVQQQLNKMLQQVSAKLHMQQLSHLGLEASRESLTPIIQQLQGELPLRFNEQILPLTYHIQCFEEKTTKENKEEKNKNETKEKTRRWQVFMSLDLPNNETLHCKINLVDDHINTTLWAESEKLCRKTQSLMSDLETRFTQAGLIVDTLQCFAGSPPQDETSLSYNLVDITT